MALRTMFGWLPRPLFRMVRASYHGIINAKWAVVRVGERTWAAWPETSWRFAPHFTRHLTRDTAHGRLTFYTNDQVIGRALYLHGAFDRDKAEQAFTLLQRENCLDASRNCLIDVGANIGTVCIDMVRQNRFARAIAIEPDPANFALLQRNIQQNGLNDRITPLAIGLSSERATVTFEQSGNNYGDHRVRLAVAASDTTPNAFSEEQWRTTTIEVKRLDDVLAERNIMPSEVALLWIDVQGHEWHVLQGAKNTITSEVPVLAEFWPYGLTKAGVTPEAFTALLAELFSHFLDLKDKTQSRQDIKNIGYLFDRYSGIAHTDLLLLKKKF